MRTPTALKGALAVAATTLLAAALGSAPAISASTRATGAIACTLLSSTQLQSTLGLSQSTVLRNYDPTAPTSNVVDTECDWGVWSGAAPTTTTAMFALARSGHAAQIAIETWAPHKGHEQDWVGKDYDKLTRDLRSHSLAFPGLFSSQGLAAHTLRPPHLGHSGTGFTTAAPGLAKGLTVTVGCWWEDKSHKAICIFDEEAASRPVTAHMLQFARIAVSKFLG